jgi:TonB-dependent starch-binding outer membrane protein SusC
MKFIASHQPEALVVLRSTRFGTGAERQATFRLATKTILVMKLTLILLTATLCAAANESVSQSITFSARNATPQEIIAVVEQQAKYVFFYDKKILKDAKKISIEVKDMPVQNFLTIAFGNQPFTWSMEDRTIVLKKRFSTIEKEIPVYNMITPPPIEVRGRAANEKGEPLQGVTIAVKGGKVVGVTDVNGEFTLTNIDPQATLVFTGVNIEAYEVKVNNRTVITVTLSIKVAKQDEVVVTAYTSERKKDIVGSVSVVNVTEMNKQPTGLVTNMLQGQASGVTVIQSGQPGAEPQIRIRGINTFGNNAPLYVVDGVPTQSIFDLNANDIASLQVLKDAGAASIYGSRASNGVIVITTRKGKGKINVRYDAYYGTQFPKTGNVFDLLSPQEQADLHWMAYKNSNIVPNDPYYGNGATPVLPDYVMPVGAKEGSPAVDPSRYYVNPNYTSFADYSSFYRIIKANKAGTDWYHELFKQAPMSSHNISVDGSSEKGSYLFSFNYLNQQGTMINTYLKRFTVR